ncbi:MAG: hypothetical protein ACXAD7_19645 [Candidatus Kariarchaeaceae archaeon]|jgi:hypothetical protein
MSETTINKTWSYLMVAGAILMLLATFLPSMTWEVVGTSDTENLDWGDDLKDTDAESSRVFLWLGFLLAAVGAALGLVESMAANAKFGGIASLVAGILGLIAWWNLNTAVSDAQEAFDFIGLGDVSMGFGGWVALIGAVLAIVGGGLSVKDEFM